MKTWLLSIVGALALSGCTEKKSLAEQDAEVERLAKLDPPVAVVVALRDEIETAFFLLAFLFVFTRESKSTGGGDEK